MSSLLSVVCVRVHEGNGSSNVLNLVIGPLGASGSESYKINYTHSCSHVLKLVSSLLILWVFLCVCVKTIKIIRSLRVLILGKSQTIYNITFFTMPLYFNKNEAKVSPMIQ